VNGSGGRWDTASFRDARGRVYVKGSRVFRALTPAGAEDWRALSASPAWGELQEQGKVVRTWAPPDVDVEPPAVCVLEHAPLTVITYAFEWPFSLLQDAALLYLDLLHRLVPAGFTLIDGTSRNVMFEGMRPVFIDVLSIVPSRGRAVWFGLNQFLETMVYPLMLAAYKGMPYHAWLRGSAELALPTSDVARLFGWRDTLKPGVVTLLKLKRALDRFAQTEGFTPPPASQAGREDGRLLVHTLTRLRSVVASLKPRFEKTPWTSYADCVAANYDDDARSRKRRTVDTAVSRAAPGGVVWDLGCNTGEYSTIAASHARLVVAIDDDHGVVDSLCVAARTQGLHNLLPLVADAAWPSPGLGWDAAECRPLWARGRADLVLALALQHHVVLTRHVPCELLLQTLARLGRNCLFEYIAPQDPQAQRMSSNLAEGHQQLPERSEFEAILAQWFRVESVTEVTGTRSLYMLQSGIVAGVPAAEEFPASAGGRGSAW